MNEAESQFIRRGIAAIEATRRNGTGIPAAAVIAKLDAKLAQAKAFQRPRKNQ